MTLGYDETVLVTGFPNFRGRKMVEHLLSADERSLVYVVVQPKFSELATAALEQLPRAQRERVVVFDGDAAAIDLGLSGAEYKEIAARVHRIHHMAQATYPGVSRKQAEHVNIGSMREILELGKACHDLKCIVMHSSALVSGNRTGLVLEEELNAGQTFRSVVEETLARSERLARANMADLPIAVVRPTQIVGDSQTGEVDRFDGPYLLILLIVSSPQDFPVLLPARGDAPMNVVPIDFVVRAARHIGREPRAAGRTFHLTDPKPLTVRQMFDFVAQAGGRRLPSGFIPSRLTKALLGAPGLNLLSKSPRAFVDTIATPVRYGTRNTDDILAGSQIRCPPFESYVDELVCYVKQRVAERRSREEEAEIHDPLS